MDPTVQMIITIVASVIASSGFWAYMTQRSSRKDVKTQLLMGLAHDRITSLGLFYLDRGDWITNDEYENLQYLYKPYTKMGGNGSAKRIMDEVDRCLKIVPAKYKSCDKK